jgi:hypothetical protein
MRPTVEDEKKLKIRNFRMSDQDWKILEQHFQERRIPIATGVRMILVEYMKGKKLLR